MGLYLLRIFVLVMSLISLYFTMFHDMRFLSWCDVGVNHIAKLYWYLYANWISVYKYPYYFLNWKPEVFIDNGAKSSKPTYSLVLNFVDKL